MTAVVMLALGIRGAIRGYQNRTRALIEEALDRASSLPLAELSGPPGIVLHHSETPARVRGIAVDAARLSEIHATDHPDWRMEYEGKTYYIGYHYVVLPDGRIEKGRPDLCQGAHARAYNHWIGICVIGDFRSHSRHHWWPGTPTPEQVRAILSLCQELMAKFHIPPSLIKRHRDVNQTNCPGDRFPFREIIDRLREFAVTHADLHPLPPRFLKIVRQGPRRHAGASLPR